MHLFDTKAPTAAEVSSLRFIVSVTTLSGEWLGFHDVGNMLQLCGGRKADLAEWMRFGTYYVNTCKLPLLEAGRVTFSVMHKLTCGIH